MSRRRLTIPPSLRFAVLERDRFTCQYCGAQAPDAQLVIDHIVPVARGGDDAFDNLCAACLRCNQGKQDHDTWPLAYQSITRERRLIELGEQIVEDVELACWHASADSYYPPHDDLIPLLHRLVPRFGIGIVTRALIALSRRRYMRGDAAWSPPSGYRYVREVIERCQAEIARPASVDEG